MRTSLVLCALLLATLPACTARSADDFQPAQLREFARGEVSIERQGGRDTFRVWLARTPVEQQQGLMWIRQLPRDQGMLFLLDPQRPMDMWMKNTYVSLDMLFFNADGVVTRIQSRAEPLSEDIISSGGEVAGVLELLAGEAQRRGIRVNDRIQLPRMRAR
jgi:uncharacterized membrane protein (UPF0127 family)